MSQQILYSNNQPVIKVRRPHMLQVASEASLGLIMVNVFFSFSYGIANFWQYLPVAALPFVLMAAARIITLILILVRDMQLLGLTQSNDDSDLIPITRG